jgi:hypothetical protein
MERTPCKAGKKGKFIEYFRQIHEKLKKFIKNIDIDTNALYNINEQSVALHGADIVAQSVPMHYYYLIFQKGESGL